MRRETLKTAWNLIKPGGIVIVIETPNRLTYYDWHNSLMHFYHMLPVELQARYYPRSSRKDYVKNITYFMENKGFKDTLEHLRRYGQSVSYHEFEIALGDINNLVIGDGYHRCLVNCGNRRTKLQDKLLEQYFIENDIKIPRGFTRSILDLILQKPGG